MSLPTGFKANSKAVLPRSSPQGVVLKVKLPSFPFLWFFSLWIPAGAAEMRGEPALGTGRAWVRLLCQGLVTSEKLHPWRNSKLPRH